MNQDMLLQNSSNRSHSVSRTCRTCCAKGGRRGIQTNCICISMTARLTGVPDTHAAAHMWYKYTSHKPLGDLSKYQHTITTTAADRDPSNIPVVRVSEHSKAAGKPDNKTPKHPVDSNNMLESCINPCMPQGMQARGLPNYSLTMTKLNGSAQHGWLAERY